jgi:hypothetical protein
MNPIHTFIPYSFKNILPHEPGLPLDFPSGFQSKLLLAFVVSTRSATYLADLILLRLITLLMKSTNYEAPHYVLFFHSAVTSSLLIQVAVHFSTCHRTSSNSLSRSKIKGDVNIRQFSTANVMFKTGRINIRPVIKLQYWPQTCSFSQETTAPILGQLLKWLGGLLLPAYVSITDNHIILFRD